MKTLKKTHYNFKIIRWGKYNSDGLIVAITTKHQIMIIDPERQLFVYVKPKTPEERAKYYLKASRPGRGMKLKQLLDEITK